MRVEVIGGPHDRSVWEVKKGTPSLPLTHLTPDSPIGPAQRPSTVTEYPIQQIGGRHWAVHPNYEIKTTTTGLAVTDDLVEDPSALADAIEETQRALTATLYQESFRTLLAIPAQLYPPDPGARGQTIRARAIYATPRPATAI